MSASSKLKMNALFFVAALTMGQLAHADIMPVYSEVSIQDATDKCTAANGQVIGQSMETTTATGTEFYIDACARPDGNGGTVYMPAWSAISFDNLRQRCATKSATTGLDAGQEVGEPIYAQPSQPDIFILICNI